MATKAFSRPYSQVFIDSPRYNSKNLYKKRRRAMLKALDSFCVFAGIPADPGSEEAYVQTWNKFVQEPAFLYLTGINQAGCYLLLDPATDEEILFVPPKDPFREFWNGRRLGFLKGDSGVRKVTGIADVRPESELWDEIAMRATRLPKGGHAYAYFFEKFRDDHNDRFRKSMLKALRGMDVVLRSAAPLHWKLRLPLEPERIEDAEAAQKVTDGAFREVLSRFGELRTERDLSLIGKGIYLLTDGRYDSFEDLIFSGLTTAKKELSLAATDMALAAYSNVNEQFEEAKERWEEKHGE